ncbi:HEPN domain-containing protein [Sphingobacterium detergens]|uniref:HEPN domain-containing protein n=1 Tax=Sphingobacterium detergens TaxID=1145106 RepID=A0A420AYC0_SPHD1|nr:HEPN domain-containing protein [Sphingobacterium detergens]RKE49524.1 HEPN domain-containing protein [Sphingobacterium detergens]
MITTLTPIIEAILCIVPVDEIYQWTYAHDGKKYQMLQINLSSDSGIHFDKARNLIKKAIGCYPNLYFNLHFPREIQKKITQGLGRTYLICQPRNRIYQNPAQETKLVVPNDSAEQIIEKTKVYITKEKTKIQSFIDGYNFYLEQKDHPHAAFMLHQAIELSLRAAENMLISDEKKSHSLKVNINYLKTFDSKLANLVDTDEKKRALNKIEKVYIQYRYNQNYTINKDVLETAYQIAINALNWIYDYSNLLFEEIREQLSPKQIQHRKIEKSKNNTVIYNTNQCNSNYRDLILNTLELHCTPSLVACFGYHSDQHKYNSLLQNNKKDQITHAYYLFIAYDSLNTDLANLQQKTMDLLPKNVSLTLVTEETTHFIKKLSKGNPFFLSLIKVGDIWFQNAIIENIKPDSITAPQLDLDYARQQWRNRYNNARCIYNAFEDNWLFCIEGGYHSLSQVLEQTCLGVISTVLQYKPQTVGLHFLMNLCRLIVPEAHATFCLNNSDHVKLFKEIIKAQQEFRYNANYKGDPFAIIRLQELTKLFIERCNQEMEDYFGKIASAIQVEKIE